MNCHLGATLNYYEIMTFLWNRWPLLALCNDFQITESEPFCNLKLKEAQWSVMPDSDHYIQEGFNDLANYVTILLQEYFLLHKLSSKIRV